MAGENKTKTIDDRMFEAMLGAPPAKPETPVRELLARVEQLERFGVMMFEWCTKLEKRLAAD